MSKKNINNRLENLFSNLNEDNPQISPLNEVSIQLPSWSWETDSNGIYTQCNEEVARAIGLNPKDFVGSPLLSCHIVKTDRKNLLKLLQKDEFPFEVKELIYLYYTCDNMFALHEDPYMGLCVYWDKCSSVAANFLGCVPCIDNWIPDCYDVPAVCAEYDNLKLFKFAIQQGHELGQTKNCVVENFGLSVSKYIIENLPIELWQDDNRFICKAIEHNDADLLERFLDASEYETVKLLYRSWFNWDDILFTKFIRSNCICSTASRKVKITIICESFAPNEQIHGSLCANCMKLESTLQT